MNPGDIDLWATALPVKLWRRLFCLYGTVFHLDDDDDDNDDDDNDDNDDNDNWCFTATFVHMVD